MIKKLFLLISLVTTAAVSTACTPAIEVHPADPGGTSASSTSGLSAGCLPERSLLNNLREQLPQEQAVVLYQAYGGEHTLLIWLVAPELTSSFPAENQGRAFDLAVNTAEILSGASVCVPKFDLLHITVVDAEYMQWFSGPVRPQDLGSGERANAGGGLNPERGGGVAVEAAVPADPPRTGDCDWPDANASLESQFADEDFGSDFYFIRDGFSSLVYAHWVLPGGEDPEAALPLLEGVGEQVACLHPRPTGISLTITGEDGVLQLSGFLPGEPQRRKTHFNFSDLSYQLLDRP